MKHISVIVPTYNHAPFVEKSLESVFGQTREPLEIIVIDDASTDNTAEVIERYLRRLPESKRRRVYFIRHRKNLTPTPTFNEGMAKAKGDYLIFLPGDDWYLPTILEEEGKILDKYPDIGVVYGQAITVKGGRERLEVAEPAGMRTVIGRDEFARLLTMGDFVPLLTAMFRRELVIKYGLWDTNLRFRVDHEFWIRLARHTRFVYLAKPMGYSRLHEANDIYNPDFLPSYEREFAYILEKHLPISDRANAWLRRRAYHAYYFLLFMDRVVKGRFGEGLRFLGKSFVCQPFSKRHLTAWMPFGWYVKRRLFPSTVAT